jgi:UDP-N-acetylmuramoyl-L-alanyl-D-glutamate--2,6-diaminopimelate ligase
VDTNQIQVRGRFEKIAAGKSDGPHVFVDYAHTPDALEKVLLNGRQYLKQIKASEAAKLWVVFGCGGDRDKAKRPLMGRSAAQNADVVVVTSDNPRSESPDSIIADIVAGLDADQFVIEPDREKAIFHALEHAAQDDCVIIAGKGHETEQIVGDQVIAFDDAEKVQQWLLENKPKG